MRKHQNTLFWSISMPNSSFHSYLLGTMHLDTDFTKEILDQVSSHITECKYYYSEVDMEDLDHSMIANEAMVETAYQLDHYLGNKKYQKLRRSIEKSFGVDLDLYKHLKAAFIANIIGESVLSSSKRSLDNMLYDIAIKNNIQTGGIESFEDQLSMMSNFDDRTNIRDLVNIGKHPNRFRHNMFRLNQAYNKQDIIGLYKRSKKGLGKLKHQLLYDRNVKMTYSISDKLNSGNSFFSFGAGHLAGYKGILRLLHHQGVTVKPLKLLT